MAASRCSAASAAHADRARRHQYHGSRKIHCAHSSDWVRGKGRDRILPRYTGGDPGRAGYDKIIPLEPEFIVPQDRVEKQDCENSEAKHRLAAQRQRYPPPDPVYFGDDLFSRRPLCQAGRDAVGTSSFVCKPSRIR
jgi:hypothetical protein